MSSGHLVGVFHLSGNVLGKILLTVTLSVVAVFNANAGGGHDSHEPHGGSGEMHRHDKWITPPDVYRNEVNNRWNDEDSAKRGKNLYYQYCLQCHGSDGKGTGSLASSLEHAPADLTNHFHQGGGIGDAYLYWRVSEGGMVAPFISMKSAMPSFKLTLTEQERWDVLTYVHQAFHKSFTASKDDELADKHHGHQHL